MQAEGFSHSNDTLTRVLLVCGAIAGPFFTMAWAIEGATRATYNPLRHPISSLSIGEFGWTQATSFILTGLLMFAFSFGLWRALQPLGGSTWAPILVGAIAVGLIGAGFFVTDPMNGYPVGTPNFSMDYTLSGRLHRLFSALVFLGLPIACFVLTRFFARQGDRRWAFYSVITGITFLALFVVTSMGFAQVESLVNYAGLLQRITLTVGWAWLTLLPIYLFTVRQVN